MKHAFLIMAYNNWHQLMTLIQCLDDNRNSIYVHIDAKSKDFDQKMFEDAHLVNKASLTFIERKPLYWGTVSEIECEMRLMEAALAKSFDYCHLLSGQDLPIKPMNKIDEFFVKYEGWNFLEFNDKWYDLTLKNQPMCSGSYKVNYYHPLVQNVNYRKKKIIKYTDHLIAHLQKWLRMRRHTWDIYSGSQFFSVTEDFAKYVMEHGNQIRKAYSYTLASSEVFMQTTIMNSPFKDTVWSMKTEEGNLRYIDWSQREGSGPKTYTMEDWNIINNLPERYLFARKFSETRDVGIINNVVKQILDTDAL